MAQQIEGKTYAGVETLIMVSYASGMPGFSPSEWVSDKLEVLKTNDQRTILITSTASQLESSENLKVIRVPSLSQRDFKTEKTDGTNSPTRSSRFMFGIHVIFSETIGRLLDFVFRRLAGKDSDGRWSWSLTSFPVVLYHCLKNPSSLVFATGGPSSAHFCSVVAGFLSRREVVLEFQDPFIGSEMNLINRTSKAMNWIETFLISNSKKTIFVTRAAARSAKKRNPGLSQKIVAIYPGSWATNQTFFAPTGRGHAFQFLHLGTLYSSRNLDSFVEALIRLKSVNGGPRKKILIHNMGEIALPQIEKYFATGMFKQTHLLPRREALEAAAKSDCLLLVQHNDTRSEETIPYKFYDYLNLGLPIFGIVKSVELRDLIMANGGYACEQGNVESTIFELKRFFGDLDLKVRNEKKLEIDIVEQFRLALSN